jgi:tetratricopeptide (TPR) repeat protein
MISLLRNSFRRCRLLFLLISLFAGLAVTQILPGEGMDSGLGGNNTIAGTVYTPAGRISTRITIRLTTMTRGDRVSSTDDRGNFVFRGVPSGSYTIIIDKEKDFEPYTQAVDVIQLRGTPPQTYTLNIRLTPKASAQPKPSVIDAALASLSGRGKMIFTKAQELEKAGDHTGAVEQLLLLTSEFPNFMLGFNELGSEYLRMGEFERADNALQSALKLDPTAFAPQLNRGIALVSLKRYETAEPVLRSAKKINEQSGPVRYFLGTALANLGKFDEAEKELVTAVGMGGKEMAEAHRILAIIYSSRGDKKRAATELETYLQINPSATDAEQLRKVIQQLKEQETQTPTSQQKSSRHS